MKLLNLTAILLLIVFLTDQISAIKEVSSDKSRYKAYQGLFIKPKLTFSDVYKKVYMSDAVSQISKKKNEINVCLNNIVIIDDELFEGHETIYKNTRRISEYLLSTISEYVPIQFYIASDVCDLSIDFNRTVSGNSVGYTIFSIKDHKPNADILIDHKQIKNFALSRNMSLLKAYMRVLMQEIIHGLGVGSNDENLNLGNGDTTPLLLTKRQVYNLRSIYGTSNGHGGSKPKPTKRKTTTRPPY